MDIETPDDAVTALNFLNDRKVATVVPASAGDGVEYQVRPEGVTGIGALGSHPDSRAAKQALGLLLPEVNTVFEGSDGRGYVLRFDLERQQADRLSAAGVNLQVKSR